MRPLGERRIAFERQIDPWNVRRIPPRPSCVGGGGSLPWESVLPDGAVQVGFREARERLSDLRIGSGVHDRKLDNSA